MDNSLTTDALLIRRAIAEKATPGPWLYNDLPIHGPFEVCVSSDSGFTMVASVQTRNDAHHIAVASPEEVISYIDAILRLRAEVGHLEDEANWLALVLANADCGIPASEYIAEDINGMSPPAPEHWREAARRAVKA